MKKELTPKELFDQSYQEMQDANQAYLDAVAEKESYNPRIAEARQQLLKAKQNMALLAKNLKRDTTVCLSGRMPSADKPNEKAPAGKRGKSKKKKVSASELAEAA